MKKFQKIKKVFLVFLFLLFNTFLFSQADSPPIVTAEGNQYFCPGNPINIVTDFSITDIDNTTIDSFFIQISSGYQINFDRLELTGNHPNINPQWNNIEGKLSLTASVSGAEILLTDIENAVKEVVFTTTSNNITVEKRFSLTIDNANYLPATDHFYEFVSSQSITWTAAKTEAENKTYYGRQGYLATLTSQEESDFAGKQASGPGWIGGSDEETEGVWKWVTGPEAGTNFWNGQVNGTSPNFAFWNNNEPNDYGGNEDYAHITDPSVGIRGAWNDLPNEGGTEEYIPKGYIVEYGTTTDPPISIVANTRIYIPQIIATTGATICESGSATISATPSEGTILWYINQTGGTSIANGNDYTTPLLTDSTTYFAAVSVNGCTTLERTTVTVVVNQRPTITSVTDDLICSGIATLSAIASAGDVNWFDENGDFLKLGNSFQTPILNTTTTYYVEANISSCSSTSRTAVTANIDASIPEFDLAQDLYVLCNDIGSVVLETIKPLGSYIYVWKKEGVIISGDASSIAITERGNYSVKAISLAGCESIEKNIFVKNSTKATITTEDVFIIDDSDNNSIEVINNNLGIGDYEFSLDDEFGIYKSTGLFQNIATGVHTLYIKDKNGCATTSYIFSILAFPRFFTPNGDGKNDVWKIDGFDNSLFTITEISIYNRFGVLLYQIESSSQGWDGTYKGKILPSNSFWFRVILNDVNGQKIEKTGSIGLVRN